MDERISLSSVVYILFKNRKLIAIATLGAALVSAGISLVLPEWYTARATILPPETMTAQTDIAGLMRSAGYRRARFLAMVSPSDVFAAILTSHRVTDAIIDSLDLMEVYDVGSRQDALDMVDERRSVEVMSEGLVEVEYEDRDPVRSAEAANLLIRELDRFNRETQISSARRVREFIESRIQQALLELGVAETELKEFKEKTGAVFISEQATVSIETAAGLYGRIAELEVILARLGEFATDRSPEVIDINAQIRALERKLAEMGYTSSNSEETDDSTLFPKFSTAPELEMRLAELMREVEIRRSVYAVLSEQYEEARIQEMRDTPTLQVLDWAHPPLIRSRPRRKVVVAISTLLAFLLSSVLVFSGTTGQIAGGARPTNTTAAIGEMLRGDLQTFARFLRHRRYKP
jgi:uncharacterized protein involved in exopolysaccharide biosynthesis